MNCEYIKIHQADFSTARAVATPSGGFEELLNCLTCSSQGAVHLARHGVGVVLQLDRTAEVSQLDQTRRRQEDVGSCGEKPHIHQRWSQTHMSDGVRPTHDDGVRHTHDDGVRHTHRQ